jgi:nucleoid DNA-binding protein
MYLFFIAALFLDSPLLHSCFFCNPARADFPEIVDAKVLYYFDIRAKRCNFASVMVGKVIRNHIESGAKKLTVPGFGTFMRREGGEVIFVDLLRGDDKTLSEMVEDTGGYSELEAMALIDRFIFETKNTIERRGSAVIPGFGTMTIDHKGVYQFAYSPAARPTKEMAVQERLFEVGQKPGGGVARAHPSAKADGVSIPSDRTVAKSSSSQTQPPRNKILPSVSTDGSHRRPVRKGFSPTNKWKTDRVLVIAMIAAAIAILIMIFVLSSGGAMPFLQK